MRVYTRALKRAGLSHDVAVALNRQLNQPDFEPLVSTAYREVKAKAPTTRYQLRIFGEFYNAKQRTTAFEKGYSYAYLKIDETKMEEEAVNDARYNLGGTNWQLVRIIEREMTEFVLTTEQAAEVVLDEEPENDFDDD